MKKSTNQIDLWIYFRSASPVYTQTLAADDERWPSVLEDVRMIRHGSHIFVHLRSQYEWDRLMYLLQVSPVPAEKEQSSAA